MNRFIKWGIVILPASILLVMLTVQKSAQSQGGATETAAGLDNLTDGYISQADIDAFRATFEEQDGIADDPGPAFNDTDCVDCHNVPVTDGSGKKISETRAGHTER